MSDPDSGSARFKYELSLHDSSSVQFSVWGVQQWDDFLVRYVGVNLLDASAIVLLIVVLWKTLVIYILPAIFFRVMLYTDQMESEHTAQSYQQLMTDTSIA